MIRCYVYMSIAFCLLLHRSSGFKSAQFYCSTTIAMEPNTPTAAAEGQLQGDPPERTTPTAELHMQLENMQIEEDPSTQSGAIPAVVTQQPNPPTNPEAQPAPAIAAAVTASPISATPTPTDTTTPTPSTTASPPSSPAPQTSKGKEAKSATTLPLYRRTSIWVSSSTTAQLRRQHDRR
jgi:hypothetical protein